MTTITRDLNGAGWLLKSDQERLDAKQYAYDPWRDDEGRQALVDDLRELIKAETENVFKLLEVVDVISAPYEIGKFSETTEALAMAHDNLVDAGFLVPERV